MRRLIACLALLAAACGGGLDDRHQVPAPSMDAGVADVGAADAAVLSGRWCVVLCEDGTECVLSTEPCAEDDVAPPRCGLIESAWYGDAPPTMRRCGS